MPGKTFSLPYRLVCFIIVFFTAFTLFFNFFSIISLLNNTHIGIVIANIKSFILTHNFRVKKKKKEHEIISTIFIQTIQTIINDTIHRTVYCRNVGLVFPERTVVMNERDEKIIYSKCYLSRRSKRSCAQFCL